MTDEHDTLTELEGVDLPDSALVLLARMGVPRDLRLPDWSGPTLFRSELRGGRLVSTTDADALVQRSGANGGYLIGSVRETVDPGETAYAVFCLRRGTGEVILLDRDDPSQDRFVDSSLEAFLTALLAFHTGWVLFVTDTPEREQHVEAFRDLLLRIDPPALADPEHYWPGWMDEIA